MREVLHKCIENEIAHDKWVASKYELFKDYSYVVVRPLKMAKKIGSKNKIIIDLYSAFGLFFVPISYGITWLRYLMSKKGTENLGDHKDLLLLTSPRISKYINQLPEDNRPTVGVIFPWQEDVGNLEIPNVRLVDLLSRWEITKSFLITLVVFSKFYLKLPKKREALHLYCLYQLVLVYRFLKVSVKEVRSICYGNHYDRWAVLYDDFGDNFHNLVIQHGFFAHEYFSHPAQKMDKFFHFTKQHGEDFLKYHIATGSHTQLVRILMNFVLSENITSDEASSILLISQPNFMEREVRFLKSMTQKDLEGVNVLVKPHPVYKGLWESSVKELNWITLIKDTNYFPKVAFAITFVSWLGVEYENAGVEVVWLDQNNFENTVQQFRKAKNNIALTNKKYE
jgi:hypothetical protein